MANKDELLADAQAKGLDVTEDNTKAEIEEALESADSDAGGVPDVEPSDPDQAAILYLAAKQGPGDLEQVKRILAGNEVEAG